MKTIKTLEIVNNVAITRIVTVDSIYELLYDWATQVIAPLRYYDMRTHVVKWSNMMYGPPIEPTPPPQSAVAPKMGPMKQANIGNNHSRPSGAKPGSKSNAIPNILPTTNNRIMNK